MRTPHIRRASEDDSAAIAALVPNLVPSSTDDHHATFVIDGAAGPVAVLDLLQSERHLELLHLAAPDLEHARALHDFAEAAARALRAREIRLRPGAMSDDQSRALGYRNGVKRVPPDGVPLWRGGAASFSQSLYYRGTWAALALLTGLGSVSLAVFSGGGITLAHILVPALLCVAGTAVRAVADPARGDWPPGAARGRSSLCRRQSPRPPALMIGSLLYDRAVPALTELWNIHSGDTELGDLSVAASPDGHTLYVSGPYGTHSEEAVRRALEQHKSLREVVLEGPGGRASAGFEIFRMIRSAQAVDTGRHRLRLGLHHRLPGRRRADHLAQRTAGLPSCQLSRHGRRRHAREQPRHPKLPGLQRPADARLRPQGDRHAGCLDLGPDARGAAGRQGDHPMIPRGLPYDEAMRRFRWNVPERFNIGRAVCERHEPHTLAMIEENADGAVRHWTFGQLLAASSRLANALVGPRHRQGREGRGVPEPGRRAHDLPPRRLPYGRGRAAAVHAVRRGGARVPA